MLIVLAYARPSVDILWPHEIMPADTRKYLHETYIDPGFITNETIKISEDGLSMKWSFQWQDEPALISVWNQDRVINSWRATRDTYALENGITKDPTKVSYFDKELNEEIEFIWEVPSIPGPNN